MPLACGFLRLLQDPVEIVDPVEGDVEPQDAQSPDDEVAGPLLPRACLREEDGGVERRILLDAKIRVPPTDLVQAVLR